MSYGDNFSINNLDTLLLSLFDNWYILSVTVFGSTMLKMFDWGNVKISGLLGYLNDGEGPFGFKEVSFTSIKSGYVCKTLAKCQT